MPRRYLPVFVGLFLLVGGLQGCGGSGDLQDASEIGRSFARITLSYTHRHRDPPTLVNLEAEAQFVSHRYLEADAVEALLDLSPGDLSLNECRVVDRRAVVGAAFDLEGPDAEVALLDGGELMLNIPGGRTTLTPRRYPDLVPFVAGVYYAEEVPAVDLDIEEATEIQVVGLGGPEVGPFAVSLPFPVDLPLVEVTPVRSGLELRWERSPDAGHLRLEIRDALGDGRRSLACLVNDDGAFLVPAAALREFGARELTFSASRVRRQPFSPSGIDVAETVLLMRDVSEVTWPGVAPHPRTPR